MQPIRTPERALHQTDEYLFHAGTARRAWQYLGSHIERPEGGEDGARAVFRVWAPHARAVSVVGDFSDWDTGVGMTRITANGLYELSLPADRVPVGGLYKYRIVTEDGRVILKADPYGRAMQCPPETATVFTDEQPFDWHDAGWLAYRSRVFTRGARPATPMNIYEMHLGSWKRRPDGSTMRYREIGDELAPYLKQMGYTHVELLPVMEHPFDGSWGYQICGYYAPTARYGSPDEFRGFIDIMHSAGIGVILDWVPAHFPKDAHGLYMFDGQPTYEYADPTRQENRGWGTCCFDVGRPEVESFLISNALYWLREFHADGLRVDAVASMLYLDYDRGPGQWHPNRDGNNKNLESVAFFRRLNQSVHETCPDCLMIAEESTIWPNVTGDPDAGEYALGFDFKWNMGWMNDTLRYAGTDPLFRKHLHGMLTHTADYAFAESYVLPISHDEVVHGKKTFLDKMPGDYGQKFAGARLFAAFMMTFPGAKLWFMGNEIGMFTEWHENESVEWQLLAYPQHAGLQQLFLRLNHFYLSTPALWGRGPVGDFDSFGWLERDNAEDSVTAYRRVAKNGDTAVVILNFTPVARPAYLIPLPSAGIWYEAFNTDGTAYGGSGMTNPGDLQASFDFERVPVNLPPLSGVILMQKKGDAIVSERREALAGRGYIAPLQYGRTPARQSVTTDIRNSKEDYSR